MKSKRTKPVAEPPRLCYKVDHITPNVRRFLSKGFIETVVRFNGTKEIFLQSQAQEGYESAYKSWHQAYWSWVDGETPHLSLENCGLDGRRLFAADQEKMAKDRKLSLNDLPCAEADRKLFMAMLDWEHHRHRLSSCALERNRPGPSTPELFSEFIPDFYFAEKIGDKSYAHLFTDNKQRKRPKEDGGGRQLRFILLWYWIPACLWAMTIKGIAKVIQARAPMANGRLYHADTIKRAVHDLRLYHSPNPPWSGLEDDPPRLIRR